MYRQAWAWAGDLYHPNGNLRAMSTEKKTIVAASIFVSEIRKTLYLLFFFFILVINCCSVLLMKSLKRPIDIKFYLHNQLILK